MAGARQAERWELPAQSGRATGRAGTRRSARLHVRPTIDRRRVAATAASLHAVDVPVAIVGLPNDELVPFDRNAARYARLIRHAQLTTVPGAGHFVFMPVCSLPGRLVAAAVCVDIATSPDRAAVHGTTAATLVRFSERTLGGR